MVLSVASKAALKIAAKKAAIARVHRLKKTVKPRVRKSPPSVKKAVTKPKTKKLTQRQMHNRLDDLQDDYHSYQKIGDKKAMNIIIKKSEAIEKIMKKL